MAATLVLGHAWETSEQEAVSKRADNMEGGFSGGASAQRTTSTTRCHPSNSVHVFDATPEPSNGPSSLPDGASVREQ